MGHMAASWKMVFPAGRPPERRLSPKTLRGRSAIVRIAGLTWCRRGRPMQTMPDRLQAPRDSVGVRFTDDLTMQTVLDALELDSGRPLPDLALRPSRAQMFARERPALERVLDG